MQTNASGAASKARKVIPVPTLRFRSGPRNGEALRLEHEAGTLGRRRRNPYCVPDPRVSRVHAQITNGDGTVVITDLGSSGGTTVNGEPLDGPCVLHHGDVVAFGPVECVFEHPTAATAQEDPTEVFEVPEVDTGPNLSPRQEQVLRLIADGLTNAEIGERLDITERTVKAYAQELYSRLDVSNRAGAVGEALRQGLI